MPPPRSSLHHPVAKALTRHGRGRGGAGPPFPPPWTTLGGLCGGPRTLRVLCITAPALGAPRRCKDLPPTKGTVSRSRGGPPRKNQDPQGLPSTYYRRPPPPGGGTPRPNKTSEQESPGREPGPRTTRDGELGCPLGGTCHGSKTMIHRSQNGWVDGGVVGMSGGSGRTLNGGEPSPPRKGLPQARRTRMLESRGGRGNVGVVGGRGGQAMNLSPLSRCGHEEGTPGISCRVEGVAGGWGTAAV